MARTGRRSGIAITGLFVVGMLLGPKPAAAASIDLAHPTFVAFNFNNIGTNVDRGVTFDALAAFTITSAGIFFDPLAGGATGIAVDIYASMLVAGQPNNPHGALLATASIAIVDGGAGFYDVPINFAFTAGNRYDIAFRSLNAGGWGFGLNDMRTWDYDFFQGDASYNVAGLVTVLDGSCHTVVQGGSACSNYGNFFMPNVRFNAEVIPEPATLALLGAGLFASAVRRRRSSAR